MTEVRETCSCPRSEPAQLAHTGACQLHNLLLECLVEVDSMDHFGRAETLFGDHMIQVSAGSIDSTVHQSVGSLELVIQCHGESHSVVTQAHFHGSTSMWQSLPPFCESRGEQFHQWLGVTFNPLSALLDRCRRRVPVIEWPVKFLDCFLMISIGLLQFDVNFM